MNEFVALSLVPMLTAILAAVSCTLIGSFLVLRRQSLIGDAMSHVALPGIVGGFLLTGGTATIAMLGGAIAAAVLAVALIELVGRTSRLEAGAAIGAVFTGMFALGVLMLEQSDTSKVHLDVEHALYGNLENLVWLDGTSWAALLDPQALSTIPRELPFLALVTGALALLIALFYKELRLITFDPDFARAIGIPSGLISFIIVVAAAITAVSAFSAVGSILVIAMYVCPAAAARLLTDRLDRQILWSAGIAALCGGLGFVVAAYVPVWLGFQSALSAAGMIAVFSGLSVLVAAVAGPRHTRLRSAA
jgi:manganese/zinc/iron transport system permease protein